MCIAHRKIQTFIYGVEKLYMEWNNIPDSSFVDIKDIRVTSTLIIGVLVIILHHNSGQLKANSLNC